MRGALARGILCVAETTLAVLAVAGLLGCAPRNPAAGTRFPGRASPAPWDARDDWPQYRGPERDGKAPAAASGALSWEAPRRLWEKELGRGASSVAVAGGRLFTLGNVNRRDIVYCLDPSSGEEIWRFVYKCELSARQFEGGPASTPTVAEGRAYTLSHEGQLFSLDVATGNPIWSLHLVSDLGGRRPWWGYAASVLVADGKVVLDVGGDRGSTVALDAATGAVLWRAGAEYAGYSSPVRFEWRGEPAVAVFGGSALVAHALSDGRTLWRFPWETSNAVNAAMPIISGERAFVSSGYGKGCAVVDFRSGEPRLVWESRALRTHFSSCLLHRSSVFGIDDSGRLKCLDFATGEERWAERGFGKGSLILAGETLVVLSERGVLVAAEASSEGYRELGRLQVLDGRSWVSPALAGRLLFVRSNAGRLVALELAPVSRSVEASALPAPPLLEEGQELREGLEVPRASGRALQLDELLERHDAEADAERPDLLRVGEELLVGPAPGDLPEEVDVAELRGQGEVEAPP